MSGSTLSDAITVGLNLRDAAYPSPLTIMSSGAIAPSTYAAIGMDATINSGYVLNQGAVTGGIGQTGSTATMGGTEVLPRQRRGLVLQSADGWSPT
jgi:hypothetical protein